MKKRITKMSLIKEVDNEMCHNYYYVVNGRVYNKDGTRYKKIKFILWNDIESICDYLGSACVTRQEIKDCFLENAYNFIECNDCDFDNFEPFMAVCNATIDDYNK